ncbi:MAG TPA: competence/damage-inducible protein A [Fimbriimonadaceae bacterium]|nr:competence/damage-inducible protein A [Fimbriimonadaceae bacterium]
MSESRLKTAEIVSVGTELLLGQIIDTHAPTMARLLASCGIACQRRSTLGDNLERLTAGLKEALERVDIVITIGGLGPTDDDLTRDAIAAALGDGLVKEAKVEEALRKFFAVRGMAFVESNAKQAMRPESATLIENPNGTAPGLLCQKNGKTVISLPGPAGEFNPMAFGPVKEFLSRASGGGVIHSRILRVTGIGESMVEDRIRHLMLGENPTVAPYVHDDVHLRLTARAPTVAQADALIDPVDAAIRGILGAAVYGSDATTLEMAVIEELVRRRQTLAVAESMTGGGVGERLTSVPGSSQAFLGGVIVYRPEVKTELLRIPGDFLARHGPVSAETAEAMAMAVRRHLGADFGLAITGNAGPTSDVDDKPVGLTFVAVAGPGGVRMEEVKYRGIRDDIRRRAGQLALRTLREELLKAD